MDPKTFKSTQHLLKITSSLPIAHICCIKKTPQASATMKLIIFCTIPFGSKMKQIAGENRKIFCAFL